jgi:hypothetical protein
MSSGPDITVTRALNVKPRNVVDHDLVTPLKTLEQPKKNYNGYGSDDEPEYYTGDTIHTFEGDEHPVIVTTTGPYSYIDHTGEEYIVGDGNDESLLDEVATYLKDHTYFLDSHDVDFVRESNNYLQ